MNFDPWQNIPLKYKLTYFLSGLGAVAGIYLLANNSTWLEYFIAYIGLVQLLHASFILVDAKINRLLVTAFVALSIIPIVIIFCNSNEYLIFGKDLALASSLSKNIIIIFGPVIQASMILSIHKKLKKIKDESDYPLVSYFWIFNLIILILCSLLFLKF